MRRGAAIAILAVLLLSGCTQRYDSPDDRSEAFGDAVAEQLRDVDTTPDDLRVYGGFDGIVFDAFLDRRSFAETRAFIESARSAADDSPLGDLPVRFVLSHRDTGQGTGTLEWRGYDPARSDRYYAALRLWLDVLADPGVQIKEKFEVEAATVFASVEVSDGRGLEAYRTQLVEAFQAAGFPEPRVEVEVEAARVP